MSSNYAANSALTSLKRARYLFENTNNNNNEDNYFYEDVRLRELAYNYRRPKSIIVAAAQDKQQQQQQQQNSSAIVAANNVNASTTNNNAITTVTTTDQQSSTTTTPTTTTILTKRSDSNNKASNVPIPSWHTPWKLSTVLSSHLGWVRSIAIDETNNMMFATGSGDRTIKLWNLPKACVGATDSLQLTLTGHVSTVRGLCFSTKHPYLFSCGEDKQIKCWDLETNQVIRHYHGHLSGIYDIKLHPTLDILISAGRDAVARIWDIRTKTQLHVLSGHEHTIGSILTSSIHPQVITGSYDNTIKLWDIIAGKCYTTLTHHSKSIRALCHAPIAERTFVSAAADGIKQFQTKNGKFLHTYPNSSNTTGTSNIVWNALAATSDGNDDNDKSGIVVSGGDDGCIKFWDYKTGYTYQHIQSIVQPGSLQQAENGIMALSFDMTGTRLITGETDKSIKIYKPDPDASQITHPINMKTWKKTYYQQHMQK